MTRVSVIVAAYKVSATIERCIDSLIAQRGVEVEIIVVNDCSPDDTAQKLEICAKRYPNLVVLQTPQNVGPATARNIGLARATGEWVAIVDGDDTIEPDRLARMIDCATQKKWDICFDNLKMIHAAEKHQSPSLLIDKKSAEELACPWTVAAYALSNCPYQSRVLTGFLKPLIRREFLAEKRIGYIDGLYNSEDYLLVLECLIHGARVGYLHEPLYNYYVYPQTLSGSYNSAIHDKVIEAEVAVLDRYRSVIDPIAVGAVEQHIMSFKLARVTNGLFSAVRERRWHDFTRLILSDKKHMEVHVGRFLRSFLNKAAKRKSRGR